MTADGCDAVAPVLRLASASPQRRTLMALLGRPFDVAPSRFDEHGPGADAARRVRDNACGKAREVAHRVGIHPQGAVLGCDTEVVLDGLTLGQPPDPAAATAMLDRLSGATHQVLSGVALVTDEGVTTHVETTTVVMRPFDAAMRAWYVDTGEWRGRAGGYAIQERGALLVERIDGDYANVVGLPVAAIARMLDEVGLAPWSAPR